MSLIQDFPLVTADHITGRYHDEKELMVITDTVISNLLRRSPSSLCTSYIRELMSMVDSEVHLQMRI